MRVLAGDIGGTKTAVGIAEVKPGSFSLLATKTYPSAGFAGLEQILEDFLAGKRPPGAAAFGVAGPVQRGRAKVTKLPWTVDEKRLAKHFSIPRVRVLNDFVAAALGILRLSRARLRAARAGNRRARRDRSAFSEPEPASDRRRSCSTARQRVVVESEGGHADFGPRDDREDRLVRFVRADSAGSIGTGSSPAKGSATSTIS